MSSAWFDPGLTLSPEQRIGRAQHSSAVDLRDKKKFESWNPLIEFERNHPLFDSDYDDIEGDSDLEKFIQANSCLIDEFDSIADDPEVDWTETDTVTWRGPAKGSCRPRNCTNSSQKSARARTTVVRERERGFIASLKRHYRYRCQVCGASLPVAGNEIGFYIEAHHIRALGDEHSGPDEPSNVLIVCPTHHKLLDYLGMGLDRSALKFDLHDLDQTHIDYHNALCTAAGLPIG